MFNPFAHLNIWENYIFHIFVPIKSKNFLTKYFNEVTNGKTPSSLFLLKYCIILRNLLFLLYFYGDFSPQTKIFIFDYFYLGGISREFNLIFCYLVITVIGLIEILYLGSFSSDYFQLPYKILIVNKPGTIFIKHKFNGQNVVQYIVKIIGIISKTLIVFDTVACK